jgi:ribose transport system ATP-binding protein
VSNFDGAKSEVGNLSPKLEIRNASKSFMTGRPVLSGVNLSVMPGEIHALAGANGSGKSTIVKILAGYHSADEGSEIFVSGNRLSLPINPHEIRQAGVRFVHQDNGFIAGMSVLDNMCLGRGYSLGPVWKIRWKEERRSIREELNRHNVFVDLDADAKTLSVAVKAKLAIIRALYCRSGEALTTVILDEPTAAMGREEATGLGTWLRELAGREGLGVLFIGHRPQELREIADRVSVLRNGQIVATFNSSEVSNEEIVEALVGSRIGSFYPARKNALRDPNAVLEVEDLSGPRVSNMSFSLYPGEIVGVTGLQGAGFEELPYLLFDSQRGATGKLVRRGVEVDLSRTPISDHISRGMVLVPGDRANNSIVTDLSIRENITQPKLRQFIKGGLLRSREESNDAQRVAQAFGVTPVSLETRLGALSGGNQQKVVVGKWMALSPEVVLLHEPTEGVDVLSKREVFRLLAERAASGAAILISSIEYEDLAHICDRILVCGHGRIRMELKGEAVTGDDVVRAAFQASLEDDSEEERVTWSVG